MTVQHLMIHQLPALAAQPATGSSKTSEVPGFVVEDAEPSYSFPQLCPERVHLCVLRGKGSNQQRQQGLQKR